MKTILLTLSMIFTLQSFANDETVTCSLTKESLDKVDQREMDGGIWFLKIPYDFNLEISRVQMLMKFKFSDSIGVRGYYDNEREVVVNFANYTHSEYPWNNKYGWEDKSTFKYTNELITGKYSYKSLSFLTSSGDPVLHKYTISYDQVNKSGTLKTSNNILIKKLTKYELDFTCN